MAKAKSKIITMSAHRYFNEPTQKFDEEQKNQIELSNRECLIIRGCLSASLQTFKKDSFFKSEKLERDTKELFNFFDQWYRK